MRYPTDLPERIEAKFTPEPNTGCWLWHAASGSGYGIVYFRGRRVVAHRVIYELLVGEIPPGLDLDHVRARGCQLRCCVNPEHLEPVTRRENIRRALLRTHCPKGHPYSADNTYVQKSRNARFCRECSRICKRRASARRRDERVASGVIG